MYFYKFIILLFLFDVVFAIIIYILIKFALVHFILVFIFFINCLICLFYLTYYFTPFNFFKSFFLFNSKVCNSIPSIGRKSGLLFNFSYILNKSNHNRHLRSYINLKYRGNNNRSDFFWVYYEDGFKAYHVTNLFTVKKNSSYVSDSNLKFLTWYLNLTYNVTGRYFYLDVKDFDNKDSYFFYTLSNDPSYIKAYKVAEANYSFFLDVLSNGTGQLDFDSSLISYHNKGVSFFIHINIPTKNILIKSDLENKLSHDINRDIFDNYAKDVYVVKVYY